MAFYLNWPADTGDTSTNTAGVRITGISAVDPTNVAIEFATDMPAPTTQRYLFMEGEGSSDRIEQYPNGNVLEQGTSNYTLNGVPSPIEAWTTAVAGDVFASDYSAFASELWIGSRKQSTTSLYGVGISKVIITDGVGVHIIDMNTSGGTGSSVTSDTGALTATLINFATDDSQWVSDGPFIAITSTTPITPGDTVAGTYANYETVPSTLTVTRGSYSLTTANGGLSNVVINDNGDGTGTFSADVVGRPANNASIDWIGFGTSTVELT